MAKTLRLPAYKFSHRAGGRYYWRRPMLDMYGDQTAYEEVVSCSVEWFWRAGPISTFHVGFQKDRPC